MTIAINGYVRAGMIIGFFLYILSAKKVKNIRPENMLNSTTFVNSKFPFT